jgi:hypothetical protein
MIASTSPCGRLQFSVEKANKERLDASIFDAQVIAVRTFWVPFLWPCALKKLRWAAQRPLPSIIIPICFGSFESISINIACWPFLPRAGYLFYSHYTQNSHEYSHFLIHIEIWARVCALQRATLIEKELYSIYIYYCRYI